MKTIEKIELGLYEIARECRIIDRVATSHETLNAIHEAGGHKIDGILKELPEQHEDFLKDVHGKVVELLEMVGEYMNGCDMVSAVDVAINKPIYDLVYERKTEEDFEEED
jgi:hypothetical protein